MTINVDDDRFTLDVRVDSYQQRATLEDPGDPAEWTVRGATYMGHALPQAIVDALASEFEDDINYAIEDSR